MKSSHPDVPAGWTRVYVQVPLWLARAMKDATKQEGFGSYKLLSTAAFGYLLGLPESTRKALLDHVQTETRRGAECVSIQSIADTVKSQAKSDTGPELRSHHDAEMADRRGEPG